VTRLKRSPSGRRNHRCGRIDPRNPSEDVIPAAITGQKRLLSSHQIGRTGTTWRPSRPLSR